jgi:RNA polymerase sigma-B factor
MILHLRFEEGLTQSGIAERVGLSQMHISRLIQQALGRLREHVNRPGPSLRRPVPPARGRGAKPAAGGPVLVTEAAAASRPR